MGDITHCRPTGSRRTAEIMVPQISEKTISTSFPVGGIRGVCVYLHGISTPRQLVPPPLPTQNISLGLFGFYDFTFQLMSDLNTDGWLWVQAPYPEDFYSGGFGIQALYNSLVADSGHGDIYLNATTMDWWDHVVKLIRRKYGGPALPIVVMGFSWGGWHTLQIASKKPETLVGYAALSPAADIALANPNNTGGLDFASKDTSGMWVPQNALDDLDIPGFIGYGDIDNSVGYTSTTVAAGSNGADVASYTGAGVLHVADATKMLNGPNIKVITSTGYAIITFQNNNDGAQLESCKTVFGSGVISTGAKVYQNYTGDIIAEQQASKPSNKVTTHVEAGFGHVVTTGAAKAVSDYVAAKLTPNYPAVY